MVVFHAVVAGALAVLREVAVVTLLVPDGTVATASQDFRGISSTPVVDSDSLIDLALSLNLMGGAVVFGTGAGATTGDGAGPGCSTTLPLAGATVAVATEEAQHRFKRAPAGRFHCRAPIWWLKK